MDFFLGTAESFINPKERADVENTIFKLHYKATVYFLTACVVLCTAYAFFGLPMRCMSNDDIPEDVLSSYCWIHTTFSVEGAWNKTVGEDVVYPGVETHTKNDTKVFHAYYQWISFFLMLCGLFFYVPKYIWRLYEDHTIDKVIMSLGNPVLEKDVKNGQREALVGYLYRNLNNHNSYFFAYVGAEILNLVNVVGQIFFIDFFLNGYFTSYGTDVLSHSEWDYGIRYDPMIRLFPRVTKCTFYRYGPGGGLQKHDTLCILPLNIVNEKIFIFLWFWFIILAVLSTLVLVYRLLLILSRSLRFRVMLMKSMTIDNDKLEKVTDELSFGDYMFLSLIVKNIYPLTFNEIISDLSGLLDEYPSKTPSESSA